MFNPLIYKPRELTYFNAHTLILHAKMPFCFIGLCDADIVLFNLKPAIEPVHLHRLKHGTEGNLLPPVKIFTADLLLILRGKRVFIFISDIRNRCLVLIPILVFKLKFDIELLLKPIGQRTVDGKARLKSGRGLLKCFPIMKIRGE